MRGAAKIVDIECAFQAWIQTKIRFLAKCRGRVVNHSDFKIKKIQCNSLSLTTLLFHVFSYCSAFSKLRRLFCTEMGSKQLDVQRVLFTRKY